jgi:predicted dehydrogenase
MNRRGFLTQSLSSVAAAQGAGGPLRAGIVGVGDRGSFHMDTLLGMGVEVPAICDINADYLYRAKRWIEEAKRPSPRLYDRGPGDFLRLCEKEELDLVVTATPWDLHVPVCLAAMKNGKHAATEVPAATTVEDCWSLVETSEKTGKQCIMLEQANYSDRSLAVLEMARKGVFGELLFASGGYVHDLRLVKFDPEREPWRLQHSIDRNGNLYPTHPMGPIAWWLDLNRGERFEYLVSVSTKGVCINEYAAQYFGSRHPYAGMKVSQGDGNMTMLRTSDGKVVILYFDTNTPHPQTGDLRLQGTKGHYSANISSVYIEGRSPKPHQWEPLESYMREFQSPLYRGLDPQKYRTARGHGGGVTTAMMWERLLHALKTGVEFEQNVYDAATWSVLSPLSERSVESRSRPVEFPDFTRGKWKNTPPVSLTAAS